MDNIAVLIAILVVLITIGCFVFFFRKKVKRDGVLLMGLSNSGKTLICARLACGQKFVETYTSMKENVKAYSTGRTSVQLIDVPGQERVRGRVFDHYKASARAVVFIVDSSRVQQDIRDVAEYLHNILTDATIFSNRPDLLVLCNKQDESLSKSSASIRSLLEKELNIVRTTKASQRRLAVDDNSLDITLGDPEKPFKFDDLPQKVSFAESTAVMSGEDTGPSLEQLEDWIKALN